MSNNNENEIQGHNYDGITELDNPMPSWWVWTFVLTIVFAIGYFFYYQIGGGLTLKDKLVLDMKEIEAHRQKGSNTEETEEMLAAAMTQPNILDSGTIVYTTYCAVCHGAALQGQIGPNLTDNYWLHGKGTRMDIVKVVRKGVTDKGMPTWEALLKKEDIYAVTAYIISKIGSSPPNAKAPQGEPVP